MPGEKIWSTFSKKRGLNRKASPPAHDDLIDRDFTAETRNASWVGDITEHPTREGKLYLCTFKDLWSNRIVGYSMADRMTSELAIAAIRNAGLRRDSDGVIVHTDRGSQFRARAFVSTLNELNMIGSMGRVGACGDNAAAESFFSLLQKNVLNRQIWDTRDELRVEIITWIRSQVPPPSLPASAVVSSTTRAYRAASARTRRRCRRGQSDQAQVWADVR